MCIMYIYTEYIKHSIYSIYVENTIHNEVVVVELSWVEEVGEFQLKIIVGTWNE